MDGRRVLVVGASSGIGAAVARAVAARGGQVTVSARRRERLEALVAELCAGHVAQGDTTVAADARRVAAAASEAMGGLDLMVYAAGYGVLQPLDATEPDTWAGCVRSERGGGPTWPRPPRSTTWTAAGLIAFVSSRTVEDANALFASYSATKAALDQCIRVWRAEHPDRRFMRIVMGNTAPTEFSDHMNVGLLGEALEAWERQAVPGGMMHVDDVGAAVAEACAVALDHPDIDFPELKLDARTA